MDIERMPSLTGADVAAVRDLADRVAAADGEAAFDEQTLLNLVGERPVAHLVVRDAGPGHDGGGSAAPTAAPVAGPDGGGSAPADGSPLAVVGYAQIADSSAELAVDPAARRRGIGGALLDAVLADAPDAHVWAHGDLPPARALAALRGLRVVRDLWVMTAPAPAQERTDPTGPAGPVDGVRVRTFEPGRDEEAWLSVNARAFADHPEQGRTTRADLDARMAQPWFDPSVFWLAEDVNTGRVLGSMWVKISEAVGEIYVLGVDPAAQGRGIGGLLTAHAMAAFAARDLSALELYVEGENAPAIAVYERAGFRRARAHVQYAGSGSHRPPVGVTMGS
ncbi:mycothiol synthase [Occultella glacieicola]|uniref:Mycothiol acetyltransferase n=1 Tax=Occultella glacieicola TaxID=2518684 RepID=A0ABY2DXM0_9MICO|nr:mycothiol synthase [Occultella glacieicola]TDE88322.1 mycothiol synthase [Occultella glacieicola]